MVQKILRYLCWFIFNSSMSNKIVIHGNSVRYTYSDDNGDIVFSEVNITNEALTKSKSVNLKGGNLTIHFPSGVDWDIDLEDETAHIRIV